jgi:hypothetical protein
VYYFSVMRSAARATACRAPTCWSPCEISLRPSFRWPRGSFASTYIGGTRVGGRTASARTYRAGTAQHILGRVLGVLRLRDGLIHTTLPEVGHQAVERPASGGASARAGFYVWIRSTTSTIGPPLRQPSAHHGMDAEALNTRSRRASHRVRTEAAQRHDLKPKRLSTLLEKTLTF